MISSKRETRSVGVVDVLPSHGIALFGNELVLGLCERVVDLEIGQVKLKRGIGGQLGLPPWRLRRRSHGASKGRVVSESCRDEGRTKLAGLV